MDLRTARKRKGCSQQELAGLTGTDQGTISAIESGTRGVSEKLAQRLGSVLDPSGDELIIENRAEAMARAIKEGDRAGVLAAAVTVIRVASRHQLTPEGEYYLADLTEKAIKFAQDGLDFDQEDQFDSVDDGRAVLCPRADVTIQPR
jgi:transcriptional regulator with XRE-family HTH domain